MYGLKTECDFNSAHFLTGYYGKCENLHGHRWKIVAYLKTPTLQAEGTMRDMVIDFGEFKRILRDLCAKMDHTFLIEDGSLKPETIKCLEDEGFRLTILPENRIEVRADYNTMIPETAKGVTIEHPDDVVAEAKVG